MNADVEAVERIWRSSPLSPTPAANETGVTVTCLMPGATDTRFFARAGMLDTKVSREETDDPAHVAKIRSDPMMSDERQAVAEAGSGRDE